VNQKILTLLVEQHGRVDNGTFLTVQVGERHSMDVFSASRCAIPICAVESEAAIGNKVSSKFKIAGHAHCCFHRVVRDDADHHQGLVTPARNRASKSVPMKALLARLEAVGGNGGRILRLPWNETRAAFGLC
jgi:hypothetical protein